jgi:hypothetical protein
MQPISFQTVAELWSWAEENQTGQKNRARLEASLAGSLSSGAGFGFIAAERARPPQEPARSPD